MIRKNYLIIILILCFGLILAGCPKKMVMKDEPAVKKSDDAVKADEERRMAKEKADEETRAIEQARMKEKEDQDRKAKEKEQFDKSLTEKKEPGIEGKVLESALLKDIHFDFDRYDIRPEDGEIMKENAALLSKNPTLKIQIEGHCDERGTAEYNLALGQRRADSAMKYLVSLGIPAGRLSTISYGKEKPLDPAHTEEAWNKNRRGHFLILSK